MLGLGFCISLAIIKQVSNFYFAYKKYLIKLLSIGAKTSKSLYTHQNNKNKNCIKIFVNNIDFKNVRPIS